ncbi:hypothetical protein ACFXTH_044964 [Malus domestica]
MAATATAAGPRYAPEDPTLPKPWRGLVDGKTGYLYYWNPETNVTQYDRPTGSVAPSKPSSAQSISSSVHVHQSSQGQRRPDEGDDRYGRGSNGGSKFDTGSRNQQTARSATVSSHNTPSGTLSAHGGSSLKGNGSDNGSGLSAEAYSRRHEISVVGDNVPPPFTSFESTGFPSEILRERSNVEFQTHVIYFAICTFCRRCDICSWEELMSYAVLPSLWGLAFNLERPFAWTNFWEGLSKSPKFVAGTAVGDSVCHSVRMKEEASSCSSLLLQALVACNGGVQKEGFSAPTPIQAQSWPVALQSRDIVAIAKTGSGKTLGYLLPGFIHLKRARNNPQMGPTVLVLSPTRELATQILDEAVKFGKSSRISCVCLYGGAPKGPQLRDIDRGADVVVATPGRLNDILEMKRISLHQVSYLVLDEADRMLDMGFEPQIRKIVKEIPARRQTLMYTATWPKEVRKIAADLLVKPVQVNIGNVDELVANKSITQYVEVLTSMEKHRRLEQLLRSQEPGSKIIIFCSTKKMCDQLSRNLTRQFGAAAIHGDKSQSERDYVLNQFRSGRTPILVATDVAARGLDIKDIRVVINYDFPTGVEDYVHRIGRTGRAGATGLAYTFFGDQDAKYASDLIKVLEGANQRVPPEVRELASRGGGMNRFRRWGSGPSGGRDGGRGGRNDSSYGGRDGGRGGGYGFTPSSGRYGQTNGYDRGRSPRPVKASGYRARSRSPERFAKALPTGGGSAGGWSFHKSMMERERERTRSSPPRKRSAEEAEEGMIHPE